MMFVLLAVAGVAAFLFLGGRGTAAASVPVKPEPPSTMEQLAAKAGSSLVGAGLSGILAAGKAGISAIFGGTTAAGSAAVAAPTTAAVTEAGAVAAEAGTAGAVAAGGEGAAAGIGVSGAAGLGVGLAVVLGVRQVDLSRLKRKHEAADRLSEEAFRRWPRTWANAAPRLLAAEERASYRGFLAAIPWAEIQFIMGGYSTPFRAPFDQAVLRDLERRALSLAPERERSRLRSYVGNTQAVLSLLAKRSTMYRLQLLRRGVPAQIPFSGGQWRGGMVAPGGR